MRKLFLSLVVVIISFSFVLAIAGEQDRRGFNDSEEELRIQIMSAQPGLNSASNFENITREQRREMFEEGKEVRLQIMEQNREQAREVRLERIQSRVQLKTGNYSVNCSSECEFNESEEGFRIIEKLSNGRNAEIKIMPDTASERALERLRLKVCNEDNNCTIQLKEVSNKGGENASLVYELNRERKAKVFGFINSKMDVGAEVDAETGEVVKVRKPWWAFLASEPEEDLEENSQ